MYSKGELEALNRCTYLNKLLFDAQPSTPNAFSAGVYSFPDEPDTVYVVYRGSNEALCWLRDNVATVLWKASPVTEDAIKFAQEVMAANPGKKIIVTGFSKGSTLAISAGIAINTRVIAIDCPGIFDTYIGDRAKNIFVYQSLPNLVNSNAPSTLSQFTVKRIILSQALQAHWEGNEAMLQSMAQGLDADMVSRFRRADTIVGTFTRHNIDNIHQGVTEQAESAGIDTAGYLSSPNNSKLLGLSNPDYAVEKYDVIERTIQRLRQGQKGYAEGSHQYELAEKKIRELMKEQENPASIVRFIADPSSRETNSMHETTDETGAVPTSSTCGDVEAGGDVVSSSINQYSVMTNDEITRYELRHELAVIADMQADITMRGQRFAQTLPQTGNILSSVISVSPEHAQMMACASHYTAEVINAMLVPHGGSVYAAETSADQVRIAMNMHNSGQAATRAANSDKYSNAAAATVKATAPVFSICGLKVAFDGSVLLTYSFNFGLGFSGTAGASTGIGIFASTLTVGLTFVAVVAILTVMAVRDYLKNGYWPWNAKAAKKFFEALQKNMDLLNADYKIFQKAMLKLYGATDLEPEVRKQILTWIDAAWQAGEVAKASAKAVWNAKTRKVRKKKYSEATRAAVDVDKRISSAQHVLSANLPLPTTADMTRCKELVGKYLKQLDKVEDDRGAVNANVNYIRERCGSGQRKEFNWACSKVAELINYQVGLALNAYANNDSASMDLAWREVRDIIDEYYLFVDSSGLAYITLLFGILADNYASQYDTLDKLYEEIEDVIEKLQEYNPACAETLRHWLVVKQMMKGADTNFDKVRDEINGMHPKLRAFYLAILEIEIAKQDAADPIKAFLAISKTLVDNDSISMDDRLRLFQILLVMVTNEKYVCNANYTSLLEDIKALTEESAHSDEAKQILASFYAQLPDMSKYQEAQDYLRALLAEQTDPDERRQTSIELAGHHLLAYEIWQAHDAVSAQGTDHVSVNATRRQIYTAALSGGYSISSAGLMASDKVCGTELSSHSSLLDAARLAISDYIMMGHLKPWEVCGSHIPVVANVMKQYKLCLGVWLDYVVELCSAAGSSLAPGSLSEWEKLHEFFHLNWIVDGATFSEVVVNGLNLLSSSMLLTTGGMRVLGILNRVKDTLVFGHERLPTSRVGVIIKEVVAAVCQANSALMMGGTTVTAVSTLLGLRTGLYARVVTAVHSVTNSSVGIAQIYGKPLLSCLGAGVSLALMPGRSSDEMSALALTPLISRQAVLLKEQEPNLQTLYEYYPELGKLVSSINPLMLWLLMLFAQISTLAFFWLEHRRVVTSIHAYCVDLEYLLKTLQGAGREGNIDGLSLSNARFSDASKFLKKPEEQFKWLQTSLEKLFFVVLQMKYSYITTYHKPLSDKMFPANVVKTMQMRGITLVDNLLLGETLSREEAGVIRMFSAVAFKLSLLDGTTSQWIANLGAYITLLTCKTTANLAAISTVKTATDDSVASVCRMMSAKPESEPGNGLFTNFELNQILLDCYCIAFEFGDSTGQLLAFLAQQMKMTCEQLLQKVYITATAPFLGKSKAVFSMYASKVDQAKPEGTGKESDVFQFFARTSHAIVGKMSAEGGTYSVAMRDGVLNGMM